MYISRKRLLTYLLTYLLHLYTYSLRLTIWCLFLTYLTYTYLSITNCIIIRFTCHIPNYTELIDKMRHVEWGLLQPVNWVMVIINLYKLLLSFFGFSSQKWRLIYKNINDNETQEGKKREDRPNQIPKKPKTDAIIDIYLLVTYTYLYVFVIVICMLNHYRYISLITHKHTHTHTQKYNFCTKTHLI